MKRIVEEQSQGLELMAKKDVVIIPSHPFQVSAWIDQIMAEQIAAIYGNPTMPLMYVNLSLDEIKKRFEQKTHVEIKRTYLFNAMRESGYCLHKNQKLEQVGEAHAQRDPQIRFIAGNTREYLAKGDIVLSMDAKAKIKLGCFLMNGKVWTPAGVMVPVLEYDFHFSYGQLYPEGSALIPEALMKHPAIVTPYGVYCVNLNYAHVVCGLTKDTSEFAGASLMKAYDIIRPMMPNAKRILLLSDGGGSNRSKGCLWKREVHALAKYSLLPVLMCHFPPGCSKYDPIEHRVWSMYSKNASGLVMCDLERLLYSISSTTTKTGLKVTSEPDSRIYLTESEKKKQDPTYKPITLEEFNRTVDISYFNFEGDMNNWNYQIHPS